MTAYLSMRELKILPHQLQGREPLGQEQRPRPRPP